MALHGLRPVRVFVSHTAELASYPARQSFVAATCAAIRRMNGVPVAMADFGARQDIPPDVCRSEVLGCEVFVGVIGFRYGTPVPELGHERSYTEFEFEVATEAGMPRLMFLVDECAPFPPALIDEDRTRISRFRRRLSQGEGRIAVAIVHDPGGLEAAVSQALSRLARAGSGAGGRPWMAPAPLGPIVERPDLIGALVAALVAPGPATTIGLEGPGGFGKTTIAGMVCRMPQVRERFPGGLLWTTVGEHRRGAELAALLGDLCAALAHEPLATSDPALAGGRLGELLDAREPVLLVIDDVWRPEQLSPFLLGGGASRRLVCTRNVGVVPRHSPTVVVGGMTAAEAAATLIAGLDEVPPASLEELLAATGRWPVLLALVNAAMLDGVRAGATAAEAARWAASRLAALGPTAFDADTGGRAVAATVAASMDLLTAEESARYLDLAVLPADADVPDPVVALLWRATGGLDAAGAETLRTRLGRLRLVESRWMGGVPALRLHEVLRAYLRRRITAGELAARNRTFVEAVRGLLTDGPDAWWSLPPHAGYLWRAVHYHLREAGLDDEARALACELRWIAAGIQVHGSTAAAEAELALAGTERARMLQRALAQAQHLLGPTDPPGTVGATLAARLDGVPELEPAVASLRASLPAPQLVPVWPLPDRPHPALRRILTGHRGGIHHCAFSHDSRTLATAGSDRTIRLWDVESGRSLAVLRGHVDQVYCSAFSRDGALLASAGEDRTVRLWDVDAEAERTVLPGHADAVYSCRFSPDGTLLLTVGDDCTARVWEVATGAQRQLVSSDDAFVADAAFVGTGLVLAGVRGGEVWLRDTAAGRATPLQRAGGPGVRRCVFSPDGALLASAEEGGTVRLWDVRTATAGHVLEGLGSGAPVCAFSADGSLLLVAGEDRRARLWETRTGWVRAILDGHTDAVHGCALSPDSAWLATADWDGTVRLWSVAAAGRPADEEANVEAVQAGAFSPDGAVLATGGWNGATALWHAVGGPARVLAGHGDRIAGCAFSPDGSLLATAGWDGSARLWETAGGGHFAVLDHHGERVHDCAFAPAGDLLATAADDGALRLWRTDTGMVASAWRAHASAIYACAYGPGGVLASAGADGAVRLWDGPARAPAVLTGHQGWIHACAFSPEGSLLATAGTDATVRVWDAATGRAWRVLTGHDGWVHGCAFSPDGASLVSAGADGAVRVWNLATGTCECALRVGDRLLGCAWHPVAGQVAAFGVRGVYMLSVRA